MAIRAPMMKEPESATEVFAIDTRNSVSTNPPLFLSGFPVDFAMQRNTGNGQTTNIYDRLRGTYKLPSHATNAESSNPIAEMDYSDGWNSETGMSANTSTLSYMFKRAKGFFDVVAYTGNYSGNPQMRHNLGVAPEMIIAKSRNTVGQWYIKHTGMANTQDIYFNANAASPASGWSATATHWQMQAAQYPDDPHIAYLFATLAGVSKVGSYTGNGSNQNIACGFSGGARFVLIKRTDATGDWYIWDTTRGIIAGNDPHLSLNTTAAQVTTDDSIDPQSAGFTVNQVSATNINVSSATYIFYAIA
jgi:hypothetical protein